MKCLKKYSWVKVPRGEIPFHGKGILIYYMRLASRAAFRKGTARLLWLRDLQQMLP